MSPNASCVSVPSPGMTKSDHNTVKTGQCRHAVGVTMIKPDWLCGISKNTHWINRGSYQRAINSLYQKKSFLKDIKVHKFQLHNGTSGQMMCTWVSGNKLLQNRIRIKNSISNNNINNKTTTTISTIIWLKSIPVRLGTINTICYLTAWIWMQKHLHKYNNTIISNVTETETWQQMNTTATVALM